MKNSDADLFEVFESLPNEARNNVLNFLGYPNPVATDSYAKTEEIDPAGDPAFQRKKIR